MRDALDFDSVKPSPELTLPVRFAGLILSLDGCTLARDSGDAIPLTRGEFALLRMFVTRPGRVISRDTCWTPSTGVSSRSTAASTCSWGGSGKRSRPIPRGLTLSSPCPARATASTG
jgi:hypothetical protein